jgi:hypothetical protein
VRAPPVMNNATVDSSTAALLEAAEAEAWRDLYGAAPAGFAAGAGIRTREVAGALVLHWAASGRRYFSRTIGLAVAEPATPEAIDDILDGYRQAGISMFLLQGLPHCRPAQYEEWLRERGLERFDAQDRVVRWHEPVDRRSQRSERAVDVERLTAAGADEWADFIQRVYRLDCGRWLQEIHALERSHVYVARERAEIVAARTMYVTENGIAWLGMDGPVPGVMTSDYEPDAALCAAIVRDGLELGVRAFIADIEAPSRRMDTPAYDYFGRLGFSRPYTRVHYALV